MSGHQVVVIGAGPSGVAAAVSLRDRGLHPLLMDRADEVGASWRGRYDRDDPVVLVAFENLTERLWMDER